jgi:AcrR family transcriptional regulator
MPNESTDILIRSPETFSASQTARDRLLAAGAEMIAARGLGDVNTNTIAREAGVGIGTFYGCFEDKAALYRELMALGLALLQEALAEASRKARSESLQRQVKATVAAFVDFARHQPALYRVIFAGTEAGPQGGRASVGFSPRAMENRLRALQQAGELDPAVDVALAARIFNAGQGQILLWWLDAPDPPSRADLIETLARLHPATACRR